ncbi:hypothetical protein ACT2CV_08135 [Pasteurellaceae bacterium 22721_9_1]
MKKMMLAVLMAALVAGCTVGGGFGIGTGGAGVNIGTGIGF